MTENTPQEPTPAPLVQVPNARCLVIVDAELIEQVKQKQPATRRLTATGLVEYVLKQKLETCV